MPPTSRDRLSTLLVERKEGVVLSKPSMALKFNPRRHPYRTTLNRTTVARVEEAVECSKHTYVTEDDNHSHNNHFQLHLGTVADLLLAFLITMSDPVRNENKALLSSFVRHSLCFYFVGP